MIREGAAAPGSDLLGDALGLVTAGRVNDA